MLSAVLLGSDVWLPRQFATAPRPGEVVAELLHRGPPPGFILRDTMAPIWCLQLCSVLVAVPLCNGGEDLSLALVRGN